MDEHTALTSKASTQAVTTTTPFTTIMTSLATTTGPNSCLNRCETSSNSTLYRLSCIKAFCGESICSTTIFWIKINIGLWTHEKRVFFSDLLQINYDHNMKCLICLIMIILITVFWPNILFFSCDCNEMCLLEYEGKKLCCNDYIVLCRLNDGENIQMKLASLQDITSFAPKIVLHRHFPHYNYRNYKKYSPYWYILIRLFGCMFCWVR